MMKMKIAMIFLLIAYAGLVYAAEVKECPATCEQPGGECRLPEDGGGCRCQFGYSGEDCSDNVATEYPGLWYTFKAVVLIAYSVCFIISFIAFLYALRGADQSKNMAYFTFFNVRGNALAFIMLLCLNMVLYYSIDPEGFEYTGIPRGGRLVLTGITYPLLSTLLLIILFHWAEIYNTTIEMLRREEMLEKINKKYQSNLTIEDVLAKIRFINRLKIPFIIINVIAYVLTVVQFSLLPIETVRSGIKTVIIALWAIWFTFMYIGEMIGFVYYGKKLLKVMPNNLIKNMKRVTRLVTIQSCVFLFCWIFGLVSYFVSNDKLWSFVVVYFIFRGAMLFIIITMLSLFLKVQKAFPFLVFLTSKSQLGSQETSNTVELSKSGSVELTKSNKEVNGSVESI